MLEVGAEKRVRFLDPTVQGGKPLPAGAGRGLPRRWCSERCRWQGRKAASRAAQQARDREIRDLLLLALRKLEDR